MKLYYLIIFLILLQRLLELKKSNKNVRKLKERGAKEFGRGHLWIMKALHISWFFVLIFYPLYLPRKTIKLEYLICILLLIAACQVIRFLVFRTLGPRWSIPVLAMKGEAPVKSGLYKYLKHPNYLVVFLELLLFPMIIGMWEVGVTFFLLNLYLMYFRLKAENSALHWMSTID